MSALSECVALEAPQLPRSPWQKIYGGAHALRRRIYRRLARPLTKPVVSVGNLHWGGGGKTPLVGALAKELSARGERVAILSRGYGRRGRELRVVSRGRGGGPECSADLAGDEPFFLASSLPDVAVVVGPDRHAAGEVACVRLAASLLLLDDGFSHLRLTRDLDFLAFPAADPFGGGRLWPSGRLREPLTSAAAADAAILTGADELDADRGRALAAALEPFGFRGEGFVATRQQRALGPDGAVLPPGAHVLLVSGVARPESLVVGAEELGLEVVDHLAFRDHHRYPESSLRRIRRAVRKHPSAILLATGKDRGKLRGRLDLPLGELALESRLEPRFFVWLAARLQAIRERSG